MNVYLIKHDEVGYISTGELIKIRNELNNGSKKETK